MQEKDIQISELQEQLFRMKEQLIAANMDSDKVSVSALSEVKCHTIFTSLAAKLKAKENREMIFNSFTTF